MKKLLLVDAYSMIFRSYYAFINSPRINSKGQNVSAVYGFVNIINELIDQCTPTHIAVAFDSGHDTFRTQLYSDYKAQREKTPEDIKNALPAIESILNAMHITQLKLRGYEADDIIGTVAKLAEKENAEVYMATSDKDYVQLVSNNVFLLKPNSSSQAVFKTSKERFVKYTVPEVCQRYNLKYPEQMIDLLGLQGDASDNIPGCKGIGIKTATSLLGQYETIENLLLHLNDLKGSVKTKIETQQEIIHLSKKLATIETHVPIDVKLDDLQVKAHDIKKLTTLYEELEFKSLLKKLKVNTLPPTINLFSTPPVKNDKPQTDFSIQERLVKYLLNPETPFNGYSEDDLVQLKADSALWNLYNEVELPLVAILEKMSQTGVRIDVDILKKEEAILQTELEQLEHEIFELGGEVFNVNSPKQVGYILFDKLHIDKNQNTKKSGNHSTAEEVLNGYKNNFPIVKKILAYREIKKLVSTYIVALPSYINPQTGKIHTTFNQTATATGRLSSSNPNLQNLPIRSPHGKVIRQAVIPDEGCQIVSADYSQIELRLMAHFSQDAHMIEAFAQNADIHALTAAKIFNTPIQNITSEQRRTAKTANFGIIYGISSFGLSQQLECSRTYAQQLIKDYFEAFPTIRDFINRQINFAKNNGFVQTIMGRKRYLPDIFSQNSNVRKYAERNAVNAPIQGSAADIIKKAMVEISTQLAKEKLKSAMILQIHDELCFNVPNAEVEIVKKMVTDIMQNVVTLSVPLIVECNAGNNWLEAH